MICECGRIALGRKCSRCRFGDQPNIKSPRPSPAKRSSINLPWACEVAARGVTNELLASDLRLAAKRLTDAGIVR